MRKQPCCVDRSVEVLEAGFERFRKERCGQMQQILVVLDGLPSKAAIEDMIMQEDVLKV